MKQAFSPFVLFRQWRLLLFVLVTAPGLAPSNVIAEAGDPLVAAFRQYTARPVAPFAEAYLAELPETGDRLEKRLLSIGTRLEVMDFLFVLERIARQKPAKTVQKLLQLNRQSRWRYGIISDLQLVSAKVYLAHPKIFVAAIKKLSERTQGQVFAFLAAGTRAAAPGYDQLQKVLRSLGEEKLADMMYAHAQSSRGQTG